MGFAIGGAIIGGIAASAISSSNAAGAMNNASNNALGLTQSEFNTEQANAAPYLESGKNALATLNADMPQLSSPFTMQQFQQSPGYQFQLDQGMQAMQRSAASKGLLNSVGTQQNLNNYAQGTANSDYQNALQNYMNQNQQKYNMLSGLANQGLQATGLANSSGQNYANNASNTILGAGNAQAAGSIATGNAITNGLSNGVNGYVNYNAMSNLFGNQGNNAGNNAGFNPNTYGGLNGSSQLGGSSMGALAGGDFASAPNYLSGSF